MVLESELVRETHERLKQEVEMKSKIDEVIKENNLVEKKENITEPTVEYDKNNELTRKLIHYSDGTWELDGIEYIRNQRGGNE